MEHIYMVRTISLNEKSEDDLQREFEIFKLKYPIWINKTYEEFLHFQQSWKEDKYSISYEDNAYCENYEIAHKKVINNACDINDGGSYNYIAIIKVPMNGCYAMTYTQRSDINLFKFDMDRLSYLEVNDYDTEEAKWLVDSSRGIISSR
jgi:hypothetical protein